MTVGRSRCTPCRASEWSWGPGWHRWQPAPAAGCLLWCWTGTTLPPTGQEAHMQDFRRILKQIKKCRQGPVLQGLNTLYTPFLWLNRIRTQRSDFGRRTSVETGCCGRGEGGVEALIIVQVRKKGLVFKATGLRCTPMSAETHSCQHPVATSP